MARLSALILTTTLVLATLLCGASGAELKKGQRWLGETADGIYGKGTRGAVKRWQRRHGLHPDGVVGPATWAALRRAHRHASATPVRSRGGAVRRLQQALGIAA